LRFVARAVPRHVGHVRGDDGGLVPMGTAAHELPMVIAGVLDSGEPDAE